MSAKSKDGAAVHFTLQGKGGVGKSLLSAYAAQYFESIGADVKCIDTDPVNHSLADYKALNVTSLELMDGSKLNERNFDSLMERLLSETGTFIVDNGASSFLPLANYLIENKAIEMLEKRGCQVYIHTVITGGPAHIETVKGFMELAKQTNTKNLILWFNEFFGPIAHEGIAFTETDAYKTCSSKVLGTITLAKRNYDTFGKDIELLASAHKTFDEAIKGNEFQLMAKQRIKTVQRDVFEQLGQIGF